MRSFAYQFLLLLASLTGWNTAACFAQQPTGPATLEGLLNAGEGRKPTAEADADPKRPAGTVARPKDGVQHPDLDKAWAEYDAVVAKAAEGIKAAISKQFDAATAKGDLDAAEKWQVAMEKFEEAGEVPSGGEAKAAVSAAVAHYKMAKDKLSKAYESVVKALTMEKKVADARLVGNEWQRLSQATQERERHQSKESISILEAKAIASRVLALSEQEWLQLPGPVFTVSANPAVRCDTGIIVQRDSRYLFLPCPTDRWNTSPERWQGTDFRGHDKKDRAANGMPFMRLCFVTEKSIPRYVLETPVVTGIEGTLRFVPSDVTGGGVNGNNTGSVRVKVISLK